MIVLRFDELWSTNRYYDKKWGVIAKKYSVKFGKGATIPIHLVTKFIDYPTITMVKFDSRQPRNIASV